MSIVGPQALPQPYLLFVGDNVEPAFAKTAIGLRQWAPERCIGEFASSDIAAGTGLPRMRPIEAVASGARGLVIGIANRGGIIDPSWVPALIEAMEAGLDVVSGLHAKLAAVPELAEAAARHGRRLIDVRTPPPHIATATGRKRPGMRLLTVGTDCALGKKYTALALTRAMAGRGVAAEFRATGQTGIMITGQGIPMDAVIADFIAGAAEMLSPDAATDHWDIIEGQGSLSHPSYAGVSLGLLHGSQPDVIIVCHQAGRTEVVGTPGYKLPSVRETIHLNLLLGARTNPAIRCAGVSLNTAALSEQDAETAMAALEGELGFMVADPIRGGVRLERMVDACLEPAIE